MINFSVTDVSFFFSSLPALFFFVEYALPLHVVKQDLDGWIFVPDARDEHLTLEIGQIVGGATLCSFSVWRRKDARWVDSLAARVDRCPCNTYLSRSD
jgi:hypothetical protein